METDSEKSDDIEESHNDNTDSEIEDLEPQRNDKEESENSEAKSEYDDTERRVHGCWYHTIEKKIREFY